MNRTFQIAALAVVMCMDCATDAAAQGPKIEPPAPDGVETNEMQPLVFKRRPRRHYTSVVTMDEAGEAPAAPEDAAARRARDEMRDSMPGLGRDGLMDPGASAPPPQMQPPRRPVRRPQSEDDTWKLTPQERIQREIDLLSGKSDEEEKDRGTGFGWLADEVSAMRRQDVSEAEARMRGEEEEEEAEMLMAIIGRPLPGSVASEGGAREPDPDRAMPQWDRRGAASAAATFLSDEDLKEMARRAVEASEREARAAVAEAEMERSSARADALSPSQRTERAEGESVAPSLFPWGERTGGGFAGLPSSLAPSIAPPPMPQGFSTDRPTDPSRAPAGAASYAPLTRPSVLPSPGPGWGPAGAWAAGAMRADPPMEAPAVSGLPRQTESRPPAFAPIFRSPFLDPVAPAVQGSPAFLTDPGARR